MNCKNCGHPKKVHLIIFEDGYSICWADDYYIDTPKYNCTRYVPRDKKKVRK